MEKSVQDNQSALKKFGLPAVAGIFLLIAIFVIVKTILHMNNVRTTVIGATDIAHTLVQESSKTKGAVPADRYAQFKKTLTGMGAGPSK